MALCDNELLNDLTQACEDASAVGSLERKAVLIYTNQIDRAATTVNGDQITAFGLNTGRTGFEISRAQRAGTLVSNLVPAADLDPSGFTHSFSGRVGSADIDNVEAASALAAGRWTVVVQTRYAGNSGNESYKVLGLNGGMEVSEMAYDSENASAEITFTMTSAEQVLEPYVAHILNYPDMEADFASLFENV